MTMLQDDFFVAGTSLQELSAIRSYVSGVLKKSNTNDRIMHELCLAVDEACSNIMLHAKTAENTAIVISVECTSTYCKIIIKDNAPSFNPLSIESPNMETYFQKRFHGGLGIEIIKRIIDHVEYEQSREHHSWNTLSLLKYVH